MTRDELVEWVALGLIFAVLAVSGGFIVATLAGAIG